MNDSLKNMIQTDVNGHPVALANLQGLFPIYFTKETRFSPDDYFEEMTDISRQIWSALGYAGLLNPWHDTNHLKFLRIKRDSFRSFLYRMAEMDVHWKTYCVLSFLMTGYEWWERPMQLFIQTIHWTWVGKLREYVGSRVLLDQVAFFMLEFVNLQIAHTGRAYFAKGTFVAPDPAKLHTAGVNKRRSKSSSEESSKRKPPKCLLLYRKIADRIKQLEVEDVSYVDWLHAKFKECREINSGSAVSINAIVNFNSLEPDLKLLKSAVADPWRSVREFLGLSFDCEFPDGSIPKGWRPSHDDTPDTERIAVIHADGYYHYKDGTQRRGKRHYANNKYLAIMCTPENFIDFKSAWDDSRLLSGNPSWEQYSKWGLYPGIWDEKGLNVSVYHSINNVKWRRA